MHNDTLHYGDMLEAAQDFCQIIERVLTREDTQWLADMVAVLSRIQTTMVARDVPAFEFSCFDHSGLDEKFDLFCRLKSRLGACDGYRMNDDISDEEDAMTGSLAGDFTDIYFELKWGLNRMEAETARRDDVFRVWQCGYCLHWGQRLVDAHRHLLELQETGYF